MPDPDKVRQILSEWVAKAENDLKTAVHTLTLGKDCPADTVCFHAQQVVEKYLKALLSLHGIAFPKTHNIRTLIQMLPENTPVFLNEDDQDRLTQYATVARYPGWGEVGLNDSRRAVAAARQVRRDIRKLLPGAALKRP